MRRRKKSVKEQRMAAEYKAFVDGLDRLHPRFSDRNTTNTVKVVKAPLMPLKPPPGRAFPGQTASKSSFSGTTGKKDVMQYSGSAMKGLGTMHKSNTVPVFSNEEAVDIAKMRRN